MPVDSSLQPLLDAVHNNTGPRLPELPVEQGRGIFKLLSSHARGVTEVGSVEDRTLPGPEGPIPIRVYRPTGAAPGPLPLLVWFHGGGWVIGDLDVADGECRLLTEESGLIVISVDYRLAPEHPWPAGPDDAWAAITWVAAHASEVGGDPGDTPRLAVGGDSAGGNLAALVAVRAAVEGGPVLTQQVLVYPATDLTMSHPSIAENGDGYFLTRADLDWFVGLYLQGADATQPAVSPLFAADLSGVAPAQVITAEYDPLRDEGLAYAARLVEAGVATESTCYPGMVHGFFGMGAVVPVGGEAVTSVCASLRAAFGLAPAQSQDPSRSARSAAFTP